MNKNSTCTGKTCCFTGHRPKSFPWGNNKDHPGLKRLLAELDKAIDTAIAEGAKHFICGNALGVDTWAAERVLEKEKTHPELFLEIAVPFEGHNSNEPEVKRVQERADLVHVVTDCASAAEAYSRRNRYMVDKSEVVIAVYDERGGQKGGTLRTMNYASSKGKRLIQIPWMNCLNVNPRTRK